MLEIYYFMFIFFFTLSCQRYISFDVIVLILGPDVWFEYVQFAIGGMGEKDGIEKVRNVFERAITACGLHVTKGATIWESYREFENAILAGLQVCAYNFRL